MEIDPHYRFKANRLPQLCTIKQSPQGYDKFNPTDAKDIIQGIAVFPSTIIEVSIRTSGGLIGIVLMHHRLHRSPGKDSLLLEFSVAAGHW